MENTTLDLQKNYTNKTLTLNPDYEGEVTAVLVSSNQNIGNRKSVLYLHGYIDYFFHPHVGQQFNEQGFDFYALDLRKYGRALLPHQHPNYCKNTNEYFEEISIAIRSIKEVNNSVYLLGHSTGGLIACNYMNQGEEKSKVDGLILNSPFLDFYQPNIVKKTSYVLASLFSKLGTYTKINGALSPAYAQSIHKDYYGEWDFNLAWKPINGFPTYFKWIVAISKAQKQLDQSNITTPILLLHSSGSIPMRKYKETALSHDIVLNIEDMKSKGKNLGKDVTFIEIDKAQHDIFLSNKTVRESAFHSMFHWISSLEKKQQSE